MKLDLIVGYLSDQAVKYSSLPRVTGKQGVQRTNNPKQKCNENQGKAKENEFKNKQNKTSQDKWHQFKTPRSLPKRQQNKIQRYEG